MGKMSNLSDVQRCFHKECSNLINSTEFVFDIVDSTCASVFASLFAIFGTGYETELFSTQKIIFLIFIRLNLTVVAALLNHPKTRRNPSIPFIISLCLLDLVYSFFVLPIFAANFALR